LLQPRLRKGEQWLDFLLPCLLRFGSRLLWVVGAVAYLLDYGAELVGLTALISTVAAVAEWQSSKHDEA
jgi:hypothetical protein